MTKEARGRKGKDGQEAVFNHETVANRLPELEKLCRATKSASTDYSEAIKAAAEASGFNASVIRQFVAARVGENFADRRRGSGQLELLFDEVGE